MKPGFKEIIDFIKELYPGKDPIALHEPVFWGNEKKYLAECVDSTFVSSVGPFVSRFEEAVAEFVNRGSEDQRIGESEDQVTGNRSQVTCVATVNGTAALHVALLAAGVKPGDKVITQPLTFIATANAIRYCGAEPVFIDIDKDTLGMSPSALESYLVTGNRSQVTAIVPMHTFGFPCRIDEIVAIGKKYGIPVIEDAAESLGSYYKGQHTGLFGEIGVLSFNGNKTITTGGGGMVITHHSSLITRIRHLTTQAKLLHPWEYKHDEVGYNYRMPNVNAALGLAQMEMLTDDGRPTTDGSNSILGSKRLIAQKYMEFFDGSDIQFVAETEDSSANYWLNTILLKDKEQRDEFLAYSHKRWVYCRPAWELMHTLPMYKDCIRGDLSNAEWIADRLVNLPSSPY